MTRTSHRIETLTSVALLLSGLLAACGGPDSAVDENDPFTRGVSLAKPASTGSGKTNKGGKGTAGTTTDPAPAAPSVAVAFAATLPDGAFTPLTDASIASSSVVWVVADWTGAASGGSERLTLMSPGGTAYAVTEIPFADASTSTVVSWTLPDGTRRVAYKLLIWGTNIEIYYDAGLWMATAELVGGDTSAYSTLNLH